MNRTVEILPNVFRITLPLPGKRPGPVNVYLFRGSECALVDTGTRRTVRVLERELRSLGVSFRDIGAIAITHGHLEHYGAARIIARESGGSAVVAACAGDRRWIERGLDAPWRRYLEYYTLMGVPAGHRVLLGALQGIFSFYAQTCAVERFLEDGEDVSLGERRVRVIATPGHTRGSVCLYLEDESALFSGDHILRHITPNAFVMLDDAPGLPTRMSQLEYFESLRKVELLGPRVVHPAHGRTITDLAATLAIYRRQFTARRERILSLIGDGCHTPYSIGRRLFPGIGGARLPLELYLAVSEVFTHLQVLEKDGRVKAERRGGTMHYSA